MTPSKDGSAPRPDGVLAETVYDCLRAIAQNQMNAERPGHTLSATALVHEAFIRLGDDDRLKRGERGLVLHAFAEAMRRILIEHARARGRQKRGGSAARIPLDAIGDVADLRTIDQDGGESVLAFEDAFRRLEEHEPLVAEVVRLRFFAGLSVAETAEATEISERTVNNRWAYGRAWLAREMLKASAEGPGGV